MSHSNELANKSVQAAISAIELYNKPNFSYREEAFSLLMLNAWELLLKAKWLLDKGDVIESLYEMETNSTGTKVPKMNRSGNPITHGVVYLAAKLKEDRNSGLEKGCYDNILALIEIRDNSAHFVNKDLYLGRRVLEIGTASLRNYLQLITEWLQFDLSNYNFFLMPISFYHGFESAEPISLTQYPEQIRRLLHYLDGLESSTSNETEQCRQHVALRLETKLVRGKEGSPVAFRWTNDPSAPLLSVREEDVLKSYPWTYRDFTDALRRRYENFVENREFHKHRKTLENEKKFAIIRILNPSNTKSPKQRFYNPNILQEFDRFYKKRAREGK